MATKASTKKTSPQAAKKKRVTPRAAKKVTARAVKAVKSTRGTRTTPAKAPAPRRTKKKATTSPATKSSRSRRAAKPRATAPVRTEIEEEALGGHTILTPEPAQPLLSTGSGADWNYQPDPEVEAVLEETEEISTDAQELEDERREHRGESPELSGGDIDADWEDAEEDGEETVGGTVATPDQSRVDDLGQAVGIVYQDEEPLDTEDKLEKRDRHRWELNPNSDREE